MRDFLRDTIRRAGEITLKYKNRSSGLAVEKKSEKDLVTEADKAVEEFIISRITAEYPSHGIHAEESGIHSGDKYLWIIDPIDGTTSFIHDQPFYSVSIGLKMGDEFVMGAVYAPVLNELFEAEKGCGAFLNGKPVKVSSRDQITQSVMATGFACLRQDHKYNNLPYFNELAARLRGVRRYGSAAVDMCYTACGRLEGFWELNLKIYDIAAGMVILREAGGKVTDFDGGQDNLENEVLATNGRVHEEMIKTLTRIRKQAYGR